MASRMCLVRPAAAKHSGHGLVDVLIGRFGVVGEEFRCLEYLSGLAVSALRRVPVGPCQKQRFCDFSLEPLDGDDLLPFDLAGGGPCTNGPPVRRYGRCRLRIRRFRNCI